MTYTTFRLMGFEFPMSFGDGVYINPDNAPMVGKLLSPEYVEALSMAIMLHDLLQQCHATAQLGNPKYALEGVIEDALKRLTWLDDFRKSEYFALILDDEMSAIVDGAIALLERRKLKARIEASRKPNNGFVYLIRANNGIYKIGRTRVPDNRIKTFEVKLPFEVEYEALIPTDDMHALEKQLHRRFAAKRGNGEWFALDAEDVAYIKSLAVRDE